MAIGRLINRQISLDKKVNDLSSDTCRLAFTWTISHLDRDGRIHGDPSVLKSIVFPRRTDITTAMMESFIIEWAETGLVKWYTSNGDMWIAFLNFRKNQPNMRYDKEADSIIPSPEKSLDLLRTKDVPLPSKVRKKYARREEKRREVEEEENSDIPAPPITKRPIYHLIKQTFLIKNQDFDYKREGPHLVQLEKKALARDDPEVFIKKALVVFWNLTQSNDPIFKDQPFLPSIMNSGGLWPRIIKKMENAKPIKDNSVIDVIAKEIKNEAS